MEFTLKFSTKARYAAAVGHLMWHSPKYELVCYGHTPGDPHTFGYVTFKEKPN